MARARSPNRDKAYQLWLDSKGERPLKDIASELGISDNQIRKWKNNDQWTLDGKVTLPIRKSNVTNRKGTQEKKQKQPIADEVLAVMENDDLTDKQRLFCLYYIKYFNATKAYQKVNECSYSTANAEGYKLLVNPCIKNEIHRLKQAKLNKAMLEPEDIFQRYLDIAMADMNDYAEFGVEEVPVVTAEGPLLRIDEETGEEVQVTKKMNYTRFKPSKEVDGTLISEVKQGRDGASIKLADRMKALQWLTDHVHMANDEQKETLDEFLAGVDEHDERTEDRDIQAENPAVEE